MNHNLLGLVISATVLFHRVMRMQFIRLSHYIVFNEWPMVWYVDRLVQQVLVARSFGDYAHEEDMYARLIFLFRSPETMLKVTRVLKPQLMSKFNEAHSKYKPLW